MVLNGEWFWLSISVPVLWGFCSLLTATFQRQLVGILICEKFAVFSAHMFVEEILQMYLFFSACFFFLHRVTINIGCQKNAL